MILENIFSYNRFFFSCRRVKTDISPITLYCQDLFWEEGRHWILLDQGSTPNCTWKKEKILENCTILCLFHPYKCWDRTFPGEEPQQSQGSWAGGLPPWFPPIHVSPHHTMSENWLCSLFPASFLPVSPQIKNLYRSPAPFKHGPSIWYLGLVVGDL